MATGAFVTNDPQRERKVKAAMVYLQSAMTGPRPAAEVEAAALVQGITHSTLQTARNRLHIRSQRINNQWVWIPPKRRQKATA